MCTFIYYIITFLEPDNRFMAHDLNNNNDIFLIITEGIIVFSYIFDTICYIIHKIFDVSTTFKEKYLGNNKFLIQLGYSGILLVDYLIMLNNLPSSSFRFGRVIRWRK